MKRILPIILLLCSTPWSSFAQNDSIRKERISDILDLEKFNGEHAFYIDTIVSAGDYSFYGVTPFGTGFSFAVLFHKDSVVTCEGFPDGMNKIPFLFEKHSTPESDFISCVYYGDGTTYSSLSFHLIQVSSKGLDQVFEDKIYGFDKAGTAECIYNCLDVSIADEQLSVGLTNNCEDQVINLSNEFGLELEILPNDLPSQTILYYFK